MDLFEMKIFRTRPKPELYMALLVTLIIIFLSIFYKFKAQIPYSKWKNIYVPLATGKDVDFEKLSQKEITILHWTTVWETILDSLHFDSSKCSILDTGTNTTAHIFDVPCRITFDRTYLERSHALVFHSYDLKLQELPKEPRNINQVWVYRQQESPLYTSLDLKAYPKVFNWTMTFRRDSDVYFPYGHFTSRPFKRIPPINVTNMMTSKGRLVAWIVSNCNAHSKREQFVRQLQKYIPVDIYGRCGGECPVPAENAAGIANCYDYVQSTHKFYLSFENSLCKDYITEKFFNALSRNIVPVVYGGIEPEEYLKIAPNHSFINARQFKSAEDLASYLMYLDKNDDEYLRYFKWKDEYEVKTSEDLGWCNLCQRLYDRFRTLEVQQSYYKWYNDVFRWWNYRSPGEIKLVPFQVIGQSYYTNDVAPSCVPPSEIQIH